MTTEETTDIDKTPDEHEKELIYSDKSDIRWNAMIILFITYAFIILMTLILK